jgi:hypothetical protein
MTCGYDLMGRHEALLGIPALLPRHESHGRRADENNMSNVRPLPRLPTSWARQHILAALGLPALMLLAGCAMEASFPLAPDSQIPQSWRNDPRTQGWKGYHIVYETYTNGEVVARVCPQPFSWSYWMLGWQPGCFKQRGGTHWVENPEAKPGENRVGWFSFNGQAERYEYLPPDPKRLQDGVTLRLLPRRGG